MGRQAIHGKLANAPAASPTGWERGAAAGIPNGIGIGYWIGTDRDPDARFDGAPAAGNR
jgi:hypothetical protein